MQRQRSPKKNAAIYGRFRDIWKLYGDRIREISQIEVDKLSSTAVLIFVLLGSLAIIGIALTRAIPRFSTFYDSAWLLALILNILAAWAIRRKFGTSSPWRYLAPFFLALIIFYYLGTVVGGGTIYESQIGWNTVYLSPDSKEYIEKWTPRSYRPPAYPFFIELITSGTDFKHTAQGYPIYTPINDPNSPFLRIARVQRILVLGSSLIVCFILMGLLNSPLPALFFLGLYDFGFFSQQNNCILSEPLAQAWLFLIVAAFFTFLWKGWKILLPLSGILCAALYLTRLDGAYGGVFLVALICYALYLNWRKYWLSSLSAVALPVALVAIPIAYNYSVTGAFQAGPWYGAPKIASVLQLTKKDMPLIPDEESQASLKKALEKKEIDARIKAEYPDKWEQTINTINSNLYKVTYKNVGSWGGYSNSRLLKTSKFILSQYKLEYLKFVWDSFWSSITEISRLNSIKPHGISLVLLIISVILLLFLRGWARFVSLVLVLAHATHVVIVSLTSIPSARYLYATEFLMIMAIFILGCSFFNNFLQKIADNATIQSEKRVADG